jgi:P27 family predicted phage terminase small subunit
MGIRGPAPLPSNVHQLRGNPSRLPANKLRDEVQPVIEIPDAPEHLSPQALQEWQRISVELQALGLVSKIDMAALAVYCQAYGRYVQAEMKLKELGDAGLIESTPSGYKQIGVWLQISNRAVDQMRQFLQEFGMSPSARRGLVATPQVQADMFSEEGQQQSNERDPASRYFQRA